jgi:hypothetical protein
MTDMVAGEPNDVRLKNIDGQWIVQVVENGKVTRHLFNAQAVAESYAEFQRIRLGLPGKPPICEENPVDERPNRLLRNRFVHGMYQNQTEHKPDSKRVSPSLFHQPTKPRIDGS